MRILSCLAIGKRGCDLIKRLNTILILGLAGEHYYPTDTGRQLEFTRMNM